MYQRLSASSAGSLRHIGQGQLYISLLAHYVTNCTDNVIGNPQHLPRSMTLTGLFCSIRFRSTCCAPKTGASLALIPLPQHFSCAAYRSGRNRRRVFEIWYMVLIAPALRVISIDLTDVPDHTKLRPYRFMYNT
jgi:hypothetical protein